MRLHTDSEILRCIFEMYEGQYPTSGDPSLPIDARAVAARLKCPPEMVFGRLYHDMGHRFRYMDGDVRTALFELAVGSKRHCVNFPYLVAVLAGMEAEHRRDRWTRGLAILALVIACLSAGASWWSVGHVASGGGVSTPGSRP